LPPPRKRFGQHFLEPAWVAKIIASLDASPTDRFIEIGPGRGALTGPLAPLVAELVAVEIDRDLAAHLSTTLGLVARGHATEGARGDPWNAEGPATNTVVVTADVLAVDLGSLVPREHLPARVVGNLPYNISAPILFRLFAASAGGAVIRDATVMLQEEVADRLMAEPGTSEYGVLTVYTALHARATRLLTLPPGACPPPEDPSQRAPLRRRGPGQRSGDPGGGGRPGSPAPPRRSVAGRLRRARARCAIVPTGSSWILLTRPGFRAIPVARSSGAPAPAPRDPAPPGRLTAAVVLKCEKTRADMCRQAR
jgi:16S rRNA A1518/A1519 N6-dimethyltransferase RsmA/KsgA/DIM1 with predicted DNA glycosylase/AP lyase activity